MHKFQSHLETAAEIRHSISKLDTLTIIRHGQTDWNSAGKFNSRTDLELSDVGRLHCKLSTKNYQSLLRGGVTIISSPLTRCIQTTEALFPGMEFGIDPHIKELDFGGFEGLSPAELQAKGYAKLLESWRSSENDDPILEAETILGSLNRMKEFFTANELDGKSVILTSHGAFSRILIAASIGLNPLSYRSLRLDNCRCAQIQNEDAQVRLVLLNSQPDLANDE